MHVVERPEDLADASPPPAGSPPRLRRRHPVPGTARPHAAAHRGPGPRRRPRQRHPPGRARVLAAAPAPEGHRGGAVPAARRCPTRGTGIGEAACDAARSVGYAGAGTVEFLVSDDAPDEFFFMEMNTRLQVEHPVTELVTGVDLVEWQLRIAAGEPLTVRAGRRRPDRPRGRGARLRRGPGAELPAVRRARCSCSTSPTGEGIRVDSALLEGLEIGSDYDPMLAKVIAWAPGPRRGARAARRGARRHDGPGCRHQRRVPAAAGRRRRRAPAGSTPA